MKILAFEPFAHREGHFGVYSSQVCQELTLLGHEVTLVTTRLDVGGYLPSPAQFKLIETSGDPSADAGGRAGLIKSALRGLGIILENTKTLRTLVRIHGKGQFDIVHFFDFEPVSTVLVLSALSMLGRRLKPLIVVVHAPDPSFQGHGNLLYHLYGKLSRPMLRILLSRFADGVTAHGRWDPAELAGLLGISKSPEKIRLVPYGASIPENPPSKKEAREALGIEGEGNILLFFGMLRKDKGVDLLIEAVGGMDGNCRLLLVGTPFDWKPEEILRMIRDRQAGGKVVPVLEYVPERDIPRYFAAADALVLPYKRNYMGAAGPLKTGLAFGLPVIATEVRELSEFMRMGRIGVSSEPENVESLRAAIERFVSTTANDRAEMAEAARKLAGDSSWPALAAEFSTIYGSFAGAKGR